MSIKVMTQVWDHYPDGGSELLLALALADHAHDDGGSIYPAVSAMALKIRQSERNVQYLLGKMRKRGWLEKVQEGGIIEGKHLATMYRIPVERIPQGVVGWVQTLHPTDGCNPAQTWVQPSVKKPTPVCTPIFLEPSCKPSGAVALPDWVPKESWEGWIEVRTKKKIPNTPRALKLAIITLSTLKAAGYDPRVVLDTATVRGWRGLFPPTSTPEGGSSGWWDSNESMLRKAQELKIGTTGLTTQQLRAKINERLAQARAH